MACYIWTREDNVVDNDGRLGKLKSLPDLNPDIFFVAFGDLGYYYFDSIGRHDVDLSEKILPLIDDSIFELAELLEQLQHVYDRIEITDYVQKGIDEGVLNSDDYRGILKDREQWKSDLNRIEKRIEEIK